MLANPNFYVIYTDGSVKQKPNRQLSKGGWGFVILLNSKKVTEGYGRNLYDFPPSAEYEALYQALKALQALKIYEPGERVLVKSDCLSLINRFLRKGLKVAAGNTLRAELWNRLAGEVSKVNVSFIHVIAHNGDKWNEYCDQLAKFGKHKEQANDPLRAGHQSQQARPKRCA